MKRLMELAVKLYPAAWRRRYEAEFAVLLEDVTPGWKAAFDVFRAAVGMQIKMLSFAKIVALGAALGLIVQLGAWWLTSKRYTSQAVIKLQAAGVSEGAISERVTVTGKTLLTDQFLAGLIQKYDLYRDTRHKASMAGAVAEMRKHIGVTPDGKDSYRVTFDYNDAFLSQHVTEDFVQEFSRTPLAAPAFGLQGYKAELLHRVNLERHPFFPLRIWLQILGSGLAVGLLFGVCAGFLYRSPKFAAIGGLAGLMVGLGAWLLMPDQYASIAILKVGVPRGGDPKMAALLSDQFLGGLIEKYKLYPSKHGKAPLEEIAGEMRRAIQIVPVGGGGEASVVEVAFRYGDAASAQSVTADLVKQWTDSRAVRSLEILEGARHPHAPASPNLEKLCIWGVMAGVLIGGWRLYGGTFPRQGMHEESGAMFELPGEFFVLTN